MKTTNQILNVYEIKINRKWSKVKATSMIALNNWCQEMGIKEWRMVGMQSIEEMNQNKTLTIVA